MLLLITIKSKKNYKLSNPITDFSPYHAVFLYTIRMSIEKVIKKNYIDQRKIKNMLIFLLVSD